MSPSSHKHTVREELHGVAIFVAAVWAVFLTDWVLLRLGGPDLDAWGLRPRTVDGLVGILTMTFLHADLSHITGNTLPLVFLLALLAGSRARSWAIVAAIALLGGLLLWCFGRGNSIHIGASLLVFGLVTFLIGSGIFEGRLVPLLIAIVVGVLYGGAIVQGVLPNQPGISWDGHLAGAVAGVAVAWAMTGQRRRTAGENATAT